MKNIVRKMLTAMLALVMVIGTLSGCGSSDQAEEAAATEEVAEEAAAEGFADYSNGFSEQVTIQIPVYERGWEGWNPRDNYWTSWIQENFGEQYNINVEFVSIGRSTEVQDFTQLLAAGSAPTIIFNYDYPNILAFYEQGAYQELDAEEIAYYAPTFWETMEETILNYGVVDGKQMFIMGNRTELIQSNTVSLVRKDWLDAVGMDMPTCLEEYNEMLTKFKKAGYGYGSAPLRTTSFIYDYPFRTDDVTDEERALYSDLSVAALTWEPTKEYIKNLNYQYMNGLIDPDFYLDTDGSQSKSNFISGKAGTVLEIQMNSGILESFIEPLLEQNPEAEIAVLDPAALAPAGSDLQQRKYWPFGMIYGINADATDEQRIAVWMYLEWMSQPEVLETLQNGYEGKNYNVNEDGIKISAGYTGEEKLSNNDNADYWCLVNANKQFASEEEWRKSIVFSNSPAGYEYLIEQNLEYIDKYEASATVDTCFTVPITSLSEYSSDLANLWKESYVDLVINAETEEEFEAMYAEACEEYLDAGYQEILDEKQAAYDAGQCH